MSVGSAGAIPVAVSRLGGSVALNAPVLVLNRVFTAVQVISAKRAFSLLVKAAAEVVAVREEQYVSYDFSSWVEVSRAREAFLFHDRDERDFVSTVRFSVAVPRIIRLLDYTGVPRQTVKFNRRNLYARDGGRCQYCGRGYPTAELTLDHVVPRSRGGRSTWENLVCACVSCNAAKGGRTPHEAGLKLIRAPQRPSRSPLLAKTVASRRFDSWKAFFHRAYWEVELRD